MKLTFLGCGGSTGVPTIGCNCDVCMSSSEFNNRLRSSVLIEVNGKNILIDPGPDLRQHLLRYNISRIDAVLITHIHYDHIGGLVDLRPVYLNQKTPIPVFCSENTFQLLEEFHGFIFRCMNLQIFDFDIHVLSDDGGSINILDQQVKYFSEPHVDCRSTGYIFNNKLGYVTDVHDINPLHESYIQDMSVLILGANNWHRRQGAGHLEVEGCLKICDKLGISNLFMTHLTHNIDYAMGKTLPSWARLAYDGLVIEV